MKFKQDFFRLLNMLKQGEHFAFTRFSDGEILVMQNKELILESTFVKAGDITHNFGYSEDDYKCYNPATDSALSQMLVEAYRFKKKNYFVGGICRNCNCASAEYAQWMHEEYGALDEHYTYANLLVNSNYPLFAGQFYNELKKKKIVMVCNKEASFENLGLNMVKDFRVGKNCIINDQHLIEEMKEWTQQNNIENHVYLFAASSLSEVLIYELFKETPQNTYIDIGTTLHKQLGLKLQRDYLKGYWNSVPMPDLFRSCND